MSAMSTPREVGGVFLRVRPGEREAIIVRPMNAKAGEKYIPVSKITQAQTLETIRTWRMECPARFVPVEMRQTGTRGVEYGTRQEAYGGADRESAATG